jgi:hypothetical protein
LVVSKPPAGMPMMADDVTRRRTLNRERARDVCDRWGGRGPKVRRATVIREERRARRTPIARGRRRSIVPAPRALRDEAA